MAPDVAQKMISQSADYWWTVDQLMKKSKEVLTAERYRALSTDVASSVSTSQTCLRNAQKNAYQVDRRRARDGLRSVLEDLSEDISEDSEYAVLEPGV